MIRWIVVAVCAVLSGCDNPANDVFQGYAEGEYVRVAAPFAGNLQKLQVKRGDQVHTGDPLFALEQDNEAAARREAEQRLRNAEAQLADLKKSKRPPEIEAVRAQLEQARAGLKLSEANLQRQQKLLA